MADYFNNYFTDIGLNITSKIDTNAKYPFQHYLRTPTISKFNLHNTNADEILSVINKLPTKTSFGLDHISCKILKEIKDNLGTPCIVNLIKYLIPAFSLLSLNLQKLSPYTKKVTYFLSKITEQYRYYHHFPK